MQSKSVVNIGHFLEFMREYMAGVVNNMPDQTLLDLLDEVGNSEGNPELVVNAMMVSGLSLLWTETIRKERDRRLLKVIP